MEESILAPLGMALAPDMTPDEMLDGFFANSMQVLERKLADVEAANAKLVETNSTLTKINYCLTNEYAVKGGKIQSMNDLLSQACQEAEKLKVELSQKCRENDAITSKLSELVDDEGKLLPRIKDEFIRNFRE
ncbi:hypothetical protein M9H77_29400 [Catharanthus roseus]|uniref:Uncharacterized protein n=1 Tax=Catharanthus roseus TaxID=4058 RepID=A0ACB9ZU97_CATRO|nr:hypothetical protein M9H77_29400 [Catharanthus roseus]